MMREKCKNFEQEVKTDVKIKLKIIADKLR